MNLRKDASRLAKSSHLSMRVYCNPSPLFFLPHPEVRALASLEGPFNESNRKAKRATPKPRHSRERGNPDFQRVNIEPHTPRSASIFLHQITKHSHQQQTHRPTEKNFKPHKPASDGTSPNRGHTIILHDNRSPIPFLLQIHKWQNQIC
jgi:hypothetical protein